MEMSQIRYVLTAARSLNFTRAASECNVTQPALTKGIKKLEAELGAPLFHRDGRRIELSNFGRSMLPHLQHIADEAAATRVLADNFRLLDKVPVRLGVMATIGPVRLSRFLAQFKKLNDGLELSVSEATTASLNTQLQNGEIDVAVMTSTDKIEQEFNTTALYRERYVVVFPSDHRLSRRNTVPLSDLSGEDYIDRLACEMREMVMQVCAQKKIELYAKFRSEREDWVQAMVLAGIGFAFMPEYSVTLPGLLQRPLVEPNVERQVVAVTMRGRKFSPAVEAMMRSIQKFEWPG
jgi:DNA-binding transcriptional LysR family regulator